MQRYNVLFLGGPKHGEIREVPELRARIQFAQLPDASVIPASSLMSLPLEIYEYRGDGIVGKRTANGVRMVPAAFYIYLPRKPDWKDDRRERPIDPLVFEVLQKFLVKE